MILTRTLPVILAMTYASAAAAADPAQPDARAPRRCPRARPYVPPAPPLPATPRPAKRHHDAMLAMLEAGPGSEWTPRAAEGFRRIYAITAGNFRPSILGLDTFSGLCHIDAAIAGYLYRRIEEDWRTLSEDEQRAFISMIALESRRRGLWETLKGTMLVAKDAPTPSATGLDLIRSRLSEQFYALAPRIGIPSDAFTLPRRNGKHLARATLEDDLAGLDMLCAHLEGSNTTVVVYGGPHHFRREDGVTFPTNSTFLGAYRWEDGWRSVSKEEAMAVRGKEGVFALLRAWPGATIALPEDFSPTDYLRGEGRLADMPAAERPQDITMLHAAWLVDAPESPSRAWVHQWQDLGFRGLHYERAGAAHRGLGTLLPGTSYRTGSRRGAYFLRIGDDGAIALEARARYFERWKGDGECALQAFVSEALEDLSDLLRRHREDRHFVRRHPEMVEETKRMDAAIAQLKNYRPDVTTRSEPEGSGRRVHVLVRWFHDVERAPIEVIEPPPPVDTNPEDWSARLAAMWEHFFAREVDGEAPSAREVATMQLGLHRSIVWIARDLASRFWALKHVDAEGFPIIEAPWTALPVAYDIPGYADLPPPLPILPELYLCVGEAGPPLYAWAQAMAAARAPDEFFAAHDMAHSDPDQAEGLCALSALHKELEDYYIEQVLRAYEDHEEAVFAALKALGKRASALFASQADPDALPAPRPNESQSFTMTVSSKTVAALRKLLAHYPQD